MFPRRRFVGEVDEMKSRTVTPTDAEYKHACTTPIELVPAPGAGKTLVFFGMLKSLNTDAQAYSNIDADGYAGVGWGIDNIYLSAIVANNSSPSITDLTAFINTPVSVVPPYSEQLPPWFNRKITYGNPEDYENQPLLFWIANGSSNDLGGGGVGNIIKMTTFYAVVDL